MCDPLFFMTFYNLGLDKFTMVNRIASHNELSYYFFLRLTMDK